MQKTASFSDRLRLAVKSAGGAESISKASGIPRRTLETYLSGQTEPNVSKILALATSCDVSVSWLMTGEGNSDHPNLPMGGRVPNIEAEWCDIPLVDSQRVPISGSTQETAEGVAEIPEALRTFRLLTWIKFRRPSLRKFGLEPADTVAVRVAGEVMSPLIRADDSVLLDTRMKALRADDVHIFVIGSQLLVRRLQLLPDGRALLTADYPAITPIELESESAARAVWIGKVVWVARWLISA